MGNLFSQETDNVIVKVKPYYFTRSEKTDIHKIKLKILRLQKTLR